MADPKIKRERHIDTVGCPVVCGDVTVYVTYKHVENGAPSLVHFGCNTQGACGITSWDPCPLYVAYREHLIGN